MSILIDCPSIHIIFRNKTLQPKDGETPVIAYRAVLKSMFFPAALFAGITLFALPAHAQSWMPDTTTREVSMSYCNESEGGNGTFTDWVAQGEAESFWPTTGHESVSASASVRTYSVTTYKWVGGGTPSSSFTASGSGSLFGDVIGVPPAGPSSSGTATAHSSISGVTSATVGGVNEYHFAPHWTGSEYDLDYQVTLPTFVWTFPVAGGDSIKKIIIDINARVTASQTMALSAPFEAIANATYSFY